MKIIKVISTHKKKATAGMVEAIVKLKDGSIVTRHLYPAAAAPETEGTNDRSDSGDPLPAAIA